MNWDDRDLCNNRAQATAALADVARCEYQTILHGEDEAKQNLLDTLHDFAAKWEIPFHWYALEEAARGFADETNNDEESYESPEEWEASQDC